MFQQIKRAAWLVKCEQKCWWLVPVDASNDAIRPARGADHQTQHEQHHASRPPKITHAGDSGADHQHNMNMVHRIAGDSSPVGMGNFRWSWNVTLTDNGTIWEHYLIVQSTKRSSCCYAYSTKVFSVRSTRMQKARQRKQPRTLSAASPTSTACPN